MTNRMDADKEKMQRLVKSRDAIIFFYSQFPILKRTVP